MLLSNLVSRSFGSFAQKRFPKVIQNVINSSYVKLMKLDMGEFEDPKTYESLNKLFTRALKSPRSLDDGVISPVDAFISKVGTVTDDTAFQIKSHEYSLPKLLTNNYESQAKALNGGVYANFYLSPKDYHRYHIPYDMQIKSVTHVPGKLYPVNFKYLQKVPELFVQNERIIVEAEVCGKLFFMVLVGALNVGKMLVHFEPDIHTNAKAAKVKKYTYADMRLQKGEEFGYFMMGSTIVMIAQDGLLDLDLYESSKVKFGQKIAAIRE